MRSHPQMTANWKFMATLGGVSQISSAVWPPGGFSMLQRMAHYTHVHTGGTNWPQWIRGSRGSWEMKLGQRCRNLSAGWGSL